MNFLNFNLINGQWILSGAKVTDSLLTQLQSILTSKATANSQVNQASVHYDISARRSHGIINESDASGNHNQIRFENVLTITDEEAAEIITTAKKQS